MPFLLIFYTQSNLYSLSLNRSQYRQEYVKLIKSQSSPMQHAYKAFQRELNSRYPSSQRTKLCSNVPYL